ncbi:MAG TPA: ABC transporter ATP-binding protein [Thiobacillus sp.]
MTPVFPQLTAHQIALHAGDRVLLTSLDLALNTGELLGILGANGAGKSTLISVLAGLARPASGQIMLDGSPLSSLPPVTRAQYIGLLPQGDEGGFFGSVLDFVALGRFPFDRTPFDLQVQLATWELAGLAHRSLDSLSGGERQRARLAQLAAQAPQISLLDEPLTHLDPAHQARLLAWARAEVNAGRTVAMTLHDPNWAASHCDRLLFLHGDGRWQLGNPAELLTPSALETLYGSETSALWRQPDAPQPV